MIWESTLSGNKALVVLADNSVVELGHKAHINQGVEKQTLKTCDW